MLQRGVHFAKFNSNSNQIFYSWNYNAVPFAQRLGAKKFSFVF